MHPPSKMFGVRASAGVGKMRLGGGPGVSSLAETVAGHRQAPLPFFCPSLIKRAAEGKVLMENEVPTTLLCRQRRTHREQDAGKSGLNAEQTIV